MNNKLPIVFASNKDLSYTLIFCFNSYVCHALEAPLPLLVTLGLSTRLELVDLLS